MAPAGRPRKRPPNLPAHIDLERVPAGILWHPQRCIWYVKETRPDGRRTSKRIAGADARMSELHALAEDRRGTPSGTLTWLCGQFAASDQFARLAKGTRADYTYCQDVLCTYRLRDGRQLGELRAALITRPMVQRLIDVLARGKDGKPTPSKAAHVRRYLSRLWEWGANRGHVPPANPATGIDNPAERQRRRLPDAVTMQAVIAFARERATAGPGNKGAVAPYLWAAAELAYLCRLRGSELCDLADSHATDDGVISPRRKGSRDTINRWSPRLRDAWQALADYRAARWAKHRTPTPLRPSDRRLLVAQSGQPLSKSSLDTAWQRMIHQAIEDEVITAEQRFALHDLKRRGITDTAGTRADKQQASGHRSAAMLDVYDLSVAVVEPAGSPELSTELSTGPASGTKKDA
jgi:integrase